MTPSQFLIKIVTSTHNAKSLLGSTYWSNQVLSCLGLETEALVGSEILSYPIHSHFSSEVPDVRSDQIRSTDPYRIRHDKLLHSYPVHITLNTAYFLHLVYHPFQYIGYAFFRLMFDF